jgi:hypothetical protein
LSHRLALSRLTKARSKSPNVFEWNPGSTIWAIRRWPQTFLKARDRIEYDVLGGCKSGSRWTQRQQRTNAYDGRAASLQIGECTLHRRSRVDHIVCVGDALAAEPLSKCLRNAVASREQPILEG